MSDTPETDEEDNRLMELWSSTACDYSKMLEFARKMERERDAAYSALRSIREGYGGQKVDEECVCDDCNFLRPIDAIIKKKKI
jgi:hypothetical protein